MEFKSARESLEVTGTYSITSNSLVAKEANKSDGSEDSKDSDNDDEFYEGEGNVSIIFE